MEQQEVVFNDMYSGNQLNRYTVQEIGDDHLYSRLETPMQKDTLALSVAQNVALIVDAKHLCVSSGGIQDETSANITAYYGGAFKKPSK